jgi:hypothetical protein
MAELLAVRDDVPLLITRQHHALKMCANWRYSFTYAEPRYCVDGCERLISHTGHFTAEKQICSMVPAGQKVGWAPETICALCRSE